MVDWHQDPEIGKVEAFRMIPVGADQAVVTSGNYQLLPGRWQALSHHRPPNPVSRRPLRVDHRGDGDSGLADFCRPPFLAGQEEANKSWIITRTGGQGRLGPIQGETGKPATGFHLPNSMTTKTQSTNHLHFMKPSSQRE